jgi:lipopolysaccharide biosynthesis glycosyltransferase
MTADLPGDPAKAIRQTAEQRVDEARRQRDEARRQRDEARRQRDDAKKTRDEAREQRNAAMQRSAELESALLRIHAEIREVRDGMANGAQIPLPPPEPPKSTYWPRFGNIDSYRMHAEHAQMLPVVLAKQAKGDRISSSQLELLGERVLPRISRRLLVPRTPPASVAFLTVANNKFLPGIEALLLSLLDVYPDMTSDFHILHDGTLSSFVQRRLLDFYPRCRFMVPEMAWFENMPHQSDNHKRIGKLGYMNIYGLTMAEYSHVVLLDADLLITGDISTLWADDQFVACHDCGDRPYAAVSEFTGRPIFNSGVISIPVGSLSPGLFEEMRDVVLQCTTPVCRLLDRFADQKAWNLFFRDRQVRVAPVNYNCNVKYLVNFLGGRTEGISVVHFAGPKAWFHKDYLHESLVEVPKSTATRYDHLWLETYRRLLYRARLTQFQRYVDERRRKQPVLPPVATQSTCVLIGNGPSIARTDLDALKTYERFAFNWFVLHDQFETIAPEHLVLGSHQFFGGWNCQTPAFPPNFLEELRARRHRPVIWTCFYFKNLIEEIGLDKEYEVNYILFEKPFKRFVDRVGRFEVDASAFQNDSRTGVISLAMPAAVMLGFKRILLVGCDSNYNQAQNSGNYFYSEERHTSLQTNAVSLTSTWEDGGRGHFVYRLAHEGLRDQGVELIDCTVGGRIRDVPKGLVEDFRRPAATPDHRVVDKPKQDVPGLPGNAMMAPSSLEGGRA